MWLIRASLTTLGADRSRVNVLVPRVAAGDGAKNIHAVLIGEARNIGDRLEALAARSQDKAGWIGLIHEGKDEWRVKALGPDLYDGTAGIVLFSPIWRRSQKRSDTKALALAGTANLRHQASSGHDRKVGAFNGRED